MKKTWFMHLFFLSLIVTGCYQPSALPTITRNGSLIGQTLNPQAATIDPFVDNLTLPLFATLVSMQQPYLIYVGNPFCGSCENFKPILLTYIRDTHAQIYYLNTLDAIHDVLIFQETYPTIFPASISTPTLIGGQGLTRFLLQPSVVQFYQYSRFKPLIDSFIRVGNHHTNWNQQPLSPPGGDVTIVLTVGESYPFLANLEASLITYPITLIYFDITLFSSTPPDSWWINHGYPKLDEPVIVVDENPQHYLALSQVSNFDSVWSWFEVHVLS